MLYDIDVTIQVEAESNPKAWDKLNDLEWSKFLPEKASVVYISEPQTVEIEED